MDRFKFLKGVTAFVATLVVGKADAAEQPQPVSGMTWDTGELIEGGKVTHDTLYVGLYTSQGAKYMEKEWDGKSVLTFPTVQATDWPDVETVCITSPDGCWGLSSPLGKPATYPGDTVTATIGPLEFI
jgi:hypothetical protein